MAGAQGKIEELRKRVFFTLFILGDFQGRNSGAYTRRR